MAEELTREGRPDRTATPDPLKVLLVVLVIGIAIGLGLVFGNWLSMRIYTSHKSEPIKATIVLSQRGDVVESSKADLCGKNLLLMLPPNKVDEARLRMERDRAMTLDLPMGMVEIAMTSEGRWVGVVK